MTITEPAELSYLSEAELLTELLSKQSAENLIAEYSSIYNIMLHTSAKQIEAVNGIGSAKLKKLLYIKELLNRIHQERIKQVKTIKTPQDVMDYFKDLEDKQQEELWVLLLNTKNRIIKRQLITIGTVNASLVSPREVFHAAVQNLASAIIVVHNHPSGLASPSSEDKRVTEKLLNTGKILDIPLLDHIIIAKQGGCSIKELFNSLW